MNALRRASALELARMIRTREVTSRQIVDAHAAAIERVNPIVNAVVATRFDEARREADVADAQVRDGAQLPVFHGVPCTIKESFAVTGMPNTGGLVARKGRLATFDATAVARLRHAGAIPLGVTNLSELCMWMESSNRVYGRSNNPYDPRRIVGGSSGGEGAIVGAGGSPFGLGADIGGSIRMPAFFNGVFGHKPTGTLVPGTGQFPIAHGNALRMMTTGPICRRAEDLWPLLQVLAGPDGQDASCVPWTLGDPRAIEIEGLRVASIEGNGIVGVARSLVEAQRRAVEALRARGAIVRTLTLPRLKATLEVWSARMASAGGATFCELLGDGVAVDPFRELVRWIVGRSHHTLPAIALGCVEGVPKLLGAHTEKALALCDRLRDELVDVIGDGVLFFPSFTRPAPRHHAPFFPPIQWAYTAVFNASELPVTQVPLGLSPRGLPLGVQVVARHGRDHVSIAVANVLERALGGWVPPRIARVADDAEASAPAWRNDSTTSSSA